MIYQLRTHLDLWIEETWKASGMVEGMPQQMDELLEACQLLWAHHSSAPWNSCLYAGGGRVGLGAALEHVRTFTEWRCKQLHVATPLNVTITSVEDLSDFQFGPTWNVMVERRPLIKPKGFGACDHPDGLV